MRKVSLRATDGRVDVSRSRARSAAAATARRPASRPTLPLDELVGALRAQVRGQLQADAAAAMAPEAGVILLPEARRGHLPRRRRAACGAAWPRGVKVGHAGTLDPFATGLLLVLVGRRHARPALPDGAAEDLPRGRAARLDAPTRGDRDGALEHTGRVPGRARAADRRADAAPARLLRGQGRRRAARTSARGAARRSRASRGPSPCTASSCSSARASAPASRSSARRAPTCASSSPSLGDAYCEELERTAIGPFRLEDADPERIVPLAEALAFLPERALDAEEAVAVGHGRRLAAGTGEEGDVAAHPRRRAGRDRRTPRVRRAAARRSVRTAMKVTRCRSSPSARPARRRRAGSRSAPSTASTSATAR